MIGTAAGASASSAALANGMLCHGLDFDDTHADSICHVGVVVSPAAVAVAEATGASGRELVLALVAGSEIITRIGAAAVSGYMVRGFHPTSVCGVFGAAVAAARLHGLGPEQMASALGLTGSMAAGLFAYLGDGAATKPVHAGWAAHGGILAAELAAAGAEGPRAVFEDRFGFFAAYYDQDAGALETQLADLGRRFETPRIAFKPYPACHFVHSCLDAAATLLAAHPLAPEEIARITVAVPDPGIPLVLEPVGAKRDPRTEYDAKFSLQYSIAALIVHGHVGVETYTEQAIRDPAVLELAARVEHVRRAVPDVPAVVSGLGTHRDALGSACSSSSSNTSEAGPTTRWAPTRSPPSSAPTPGSRSTRVSVGGARARQCSRSSSRTDLAACFAPLRRPLPAMQRR